MGATDGVTFNGGFDGGAVESLGVVAGRLLLGADAVRVGPQHNLVDVLIQTGPDCPVEALARGPLAGMSPAQRIGSLFVRLVKLARDDERLAEILRDYEVRITAPVQL